MMRGRHLRRVEGETRGEERAAVSFPEEANGSREKLRFGRAAAVPQRRGSRALTARAFYYS